MILCCCYCIIHPINVNRIIISLPVWLNQVWNKRLHPINHKKNRAVCGVTYVAISNHLLCVSVEQISCAASWSNILWAWLLSNISCISLWTNIYCHGAISHICDYRSISHAYHNRAIYHVFHYGAISHDHDIWAISHVHLYGEIPRSSLWCSTELLNYSLNYYSYHELSIIQFSLCKPINLYHDFNPLQASLH